LVLEGRQELELELQPLQAQTLFFQLLHQLAVVMAVILEMLV
jgi:hypothetical protein